MSIPAAAAQILDAEAIRRTLRRMAHEIAEHNAEALKNDSLALVGIQSRGVEVAHRLLTDLEQFEGRRPAFGTLDISMHRDDLRRRPGITTIQPTHLPFVLEEKTTVLVDDVFFTGRTIRAAMDALSDFGRPARIQLACLVDRGHRELPIRPDFVGRELVTTPVQRVFVRFSATDAGLPDGVWLEPTTSP